MHTHEGQTHPGHHVHDHASDHSHAAGHSHSHAAEPEVYGPASPAVLELGADIGAAVIYTPAGLDGAEIEIKPRCEEWNGAHTAVRRRPGSAGTAPVFAGLFFGLQAGCYDLRIKDTPRLQDDIRTLEVVGGQVTEQGW